MTNASGKIASIGMRVRARVIGDRTITDGVLKCAN